MIGRKFQAGTGKRAGAGRAGGKDMAGGKDRAGGKGKDRGKGVADRKKKPFYMLRKKVCRFCEDKKASVDYKDTAKLQKYLTERGKIIPSRISGNCARHQRELARAIKKGRAISLLPYVTE